MIQSSLISSLTSGQLPSEGQTRSFSEGQMVYGKVLKLLPDSSALVQVGNAKLLAKLETALSLDSTYWFEVQQGEELKLKVVNSGGEHALKGSVHDIGKLLKELDLPNNEINQQLLKLLVKKDFPMAKGMIAQFSHWLHESGQLEKGLNSLDAMIAKKLPLTRAVFGALTAIQDQEGIGGNLRDLQANLKNSPNITALNEKLYFKLNELLGQDGKAPAISALKALLETAANTGLPTDRQTAQAILHKLNIALTQNPSSYNPPPGAAPQPESAQVLLQTQAQTGKGLGVSTLDGQAENLAIPLVKGEENGNLKGSVAIQASAADGSLGQKGNSAVPPALKNSPGAAEIKLPAGMKNQESDSIQKGALLEMETAEESLANVKSQQAALPEEIRASGMKLDIPAEGKPRADIKNQEGVTVPKGALLDMETAEDSPANVKSPLTALPEEIRVLGKRLDIPAETLEKAIAALDRALSSFRTPSSSNSAAFTEQELALLEKWLPEEGPESRTGPFTKETLRNFAGLLGLEYEKDLLKQNQPAENDSLKSLLLALKKEQPGSELAAKADVIINKISGLQLLSADNGGPLQQIVVQYPLNMANWQTDMTMQWTGRKKKDGKIDSDHCRVLFYLELSHLREIVIDAQVQSRVINVTVINDTPGIEKMVPAFIPMLKEQLGKLDYRLSSVKVTRPPEAQLLKNTGHSAVIQPSLADGPYSRMDVKI